MRRALLESDHELEKMQALADLIDSSPTLLAKKMEMHVRLTPMLDEVIAERTGARACIRVCCRPWSVPPSRHPSTCG